MALTRLLFVGAFLSLNAFAVPFCLDQLHIGDATSIADEVYGLPKYFDTEGFQGDQHAVRCFYGENRSLPSIEWDSKFKITKIQGTTLQRGALTLCKGDSHREIESKLGVAESVNGTVEAYHDDAQSELQVHYDSQGFVDSFSLSRRSVNSRIRPSSQSNGPEGIPW
jgi:hypothetical protein